MTQYVPVPWVFVLVYLCGVGVEFSRPTHAVDKTFPAVNTVGVGLFLLGAALAGWGWVTFRRARTTTVPGQASSRLIEERKLTEVFGNTYEEYRRHVRRWV